MSGRLHHRLLGGRMSEQMSDFWEFMETLSYDDPIDHQFLEIVQDSDAPAHSLWYYQPSLALVTVSPVRWDEFMEKIGNKLKAMTKVLT